MTSTATPFQLGDPVTHRGIVVTPLFPALDPRASYITLDEALPRGLVDHRDLRRRLGAGARRRQPARRQRAALRRRGARRREAEPDPQRLGPGRRRREAADPGLLRRAGPLGAVVRRLRHGDAHLARSSPAPQGRDALGAAARPRASRRARCGPRSARSSSGCRSPRPPAPPETPSPRTATACASSRTRSRCSRASAGPCSRSAATSASMPSRGPARSRCSGRSCGPATCSTRSSGSTGSRPRKEQIAGFVDEIADAVVSHGPSAGLGSDVRLRGPGVIGSGLELDGERIQLSAFTSDDGGSRAFGRIARPSRRR